MPSKKISTGRIQELDLLRGYFILVIIIDHIQRWPSALTYITGEGRLWVSAAEGFFIISGLLIGYLRGYKGLKKPFKEIAGILVKRAGLLYVWSIIITFVSIALMQTFGNDLTLIPKQPDSTGLMYIWQVVSQQYVFDWIYFLRLYWIMLLVTPLAILLFRRKLWWLVPIISIAVYAFAYLTGITEAALHWQVLFFVPATIGFHLESIMTYLKQHARIKTALFLGLISVTFATMALSYFWVLGWSYVEGDTPRFSRDTYVVTRGWLDPIFARDPMAPARILLAFVWFGGLLAAFHYAFLYIKKLLGWLLLPFGHYSLTAYCLQAIIPLFIQFWVPVTINPLINLLIGVVGVLLVWGSLKIPVIRKILPQ